MDGRMERREGGREDAEREEGCGGRNDEEEE